MIRIARPAAALKPEREGVLAVLTEQATLDRIRGVLRELIDLCVQDRQPREHRRQVHARQDGQDGRDGRGNGRWYVGPAKGWNCQRVGAPLAHELGSQRISQPLGYGPSAPNFKPDVSRVSAAEGACHGPTWNDQPCSANISSRSRRGASMLSVMR